jgi:zinc transport system substrate-binding protein
VALGLVAGAAGCSAEAGSSGRPEVVASFYPLYEAAFRVGGARAEVTNLTPPGVEPHDVELATDDVDLLEGADVVVYAGLGFQPGVEEFAERSDGVAVDVLEDLALLPSDEGRDPHVWLDPELMEVIVRRTESALVRADAGGAMTYRRNADAYVEELRDLDADFERGLAECERGTIVVSPALAETLAREVGVRTDVLNPIEGLTEEQQAAGEDYISLQRENLAKLREALGCP